MFGNLVTKSGSYKELSNALQERFAQPNQTELYRVQLKERRQRAIETLTELGQDIWRLTNLAYQTAPTDLRETLAKDQFIDALISADMRLRIMQARPTSLNMAVRHAVELEAFNKAERKHLEGEGYMCSATLEVPNVTEKPDELKNLKETIGRMQKTLEELAWKGSQEKTDNKQSSYYPRNAVDQKPPQGIRKRKSWICGSETHLRKNCPLYKEKEASNNKTQQPVASAGAGLFASCKINNIPAECLIDTGATLTIMSIQVWENIRPFSSAVMESYDGNVLQQMGNQ